MNRPSAVNAPRLYTPSKPIREPKYLALIRAMRWCIACGRRGHVEAAHTGARGLGQKASDLDAIPLHPACHRELHQLGPVKFQEKHKLNFREEIRKLNARLLPIARSQPR